MSWDNVQADWQLHVGQIRIHWDKLTEDELQQINGRRDTLVDMIHRKYELPKEAADEQVKVFESQFDKPHFDRDHPYFEDKEGSGTIGT